jgi:SAM-dependent methyltransferase
VYEGPTLRLRAAVLLARAIEWVLRRHRLARVLYAAAAASSTSLPSPSSIPSSPGCRRLSASPPTSTPRRLRLDITDMDLPGGSFELILCSHVLEHVPDDRAAMSELHRVLSPGGLALVLTPYRPDRPTYEDSSITKPLDRMVAFG